MHFLHFLSDRNSPTVPHLQKILVPTCSTKRALQDVYGHYSQLDGRLNVFPSETDSKTDSFFKARVWLTGVKGQSQFSRKTDFPKPNKTGRRLMNERGFY